jgi:hypothetical protein
MKRYFHTDPLAAAWQSKHFDMEFICPHGHDIWICEASYFCVDPYSDKNCACNGMTDRAFISTDSLHLLEPMVGDLYLNSVGAPEFYRFGDTWLKRYRIILRNNTPFHFPEVE